MEGLNTCRCTEDKVAIGCENSTCPYRFIEASINYKNDRFITLTGHRGFVVHIIQLADGRLVSGDYKGTVRIWDTDNNLTVLTLLLDILNIWTV